MTKVPRIPAQEARVRVESGGALLVCGYEDPAKFAALRLEGAISFQEYEKLRPTLPKEREVIFYCA